MLRVAALTALAAAACCAGPAEAARFRVVVVPHVDPARLQHRAAVGLLVPAAGPTVTGRTARASLVRGAVENSLLGGTPSGGPLISFSTASTIPRPPAIVLELPSGGEEENDRRYPIAVLGGGYRGLLTSDSTRIAGLVSIADVAPTALGRDDALGWRREADAAARLSDLDGRIGGHTRARVPAMLLMAGLIAALALALPAAAVIAFATVLVANLALGVAAVTALWAVLLVIALAVLVAVPLALVSRQRPLALAAVLLSAVVAYAVALATDGTWVSLSPLGPAQNARFYGLSNLLSTVFLVPALAAAAYVRRPAAVAAVAALALLTIAEDRLGADGGGAVVLGAGYAVLAASLARRPGRALAVALPVAAGLVLAFVGIDAATGASSHVTDALEDGPGGLARDLADRLELSYRRATDEWYAALAVAGAIAGIVALAVRMRVLALPLAFAAAIATSLVVNDSPVEVSLLGLVGLIALGLQERRRLEVGVEDRPA